jgi:DNA-binding transcriptional LysR family regulator
MASRGPITDQAIGWDDLRVALFLGRGGSVRRTARVLGVSHSTVLRRIAQLERDTGVRLFERKPGGYELTPAGQDVFDTARDLEQIVVGLERRVHGRDARLSGPVRVTLPDPLLPMLLADFFAFGRAYPEIELTLAVGTGIVDLAQREADIAIRFVAEPPAELVGRRVADSAVGIYGAKAYLARRKTHDLEALDWVGWEAGSRMAFAQWMDQHVPRARVAVRVSAGWALTDAVDAGFGVAIAPCALGEIRKAWKRIRLLPEIGAPMWILTHRDLRTTARVRVLRDFLAEAIAAKRHLIEGRTK